jgi:hypothetical protein
MDGALSDQLADQLTDGERLDLPEFHQARRSPSRPASAAHNVRMEGERQCTIMLRMLEKLTAQSAPPGSGGATTQIVAAPSVDSLRLADAEAVSLLLLPDPNEQPSLRATGPVSPALTASGADAQAPMLTVVEEAAVPASSPSDAKPLQTAPNEVCHGRGKAAERSWGSR